MLYIIESLQWILVTLYWWVGCSKDRTSTPVCIIQMGCIAHGLINAPATFMQTMNNLLVDMLDKGVVVFLDSILIYSNIVDEHSNFCRKCSNTCASMCSTTILRSIASSRILSPSLDLISLLKACALVIPRWKFSRNGQSQPIYNRYSHFWVLYNIFIDLLWGLANLLSYYTC